MSEDPPDAASDAARGYRGRAGRTRSERARVREADGSVRSIELYTVVNAATDPELAALACTGELHRMDQVRDLAVPFVYHDPLAEVFVLVVPAALAHRELDLREAWMTEVASDTEHPAPAYVQACESVLGLAALRARLDQPAEPTDGELQELAPPEAAREGAPGQWQEPGVPAARSPAPPPPSAALPVEALVIDAEPIDLDDSDVESLPPGPLDEFVAALPVGASEALPVVTSDAASSPAQDAMADAAPEELVEPTSDPMPAPDPGEMTWRIERDELWLYFRLLARHASAFAYAIDVIPQYVETDGHAVVLLTLVDAGGVEDATARLPLDPYAPADRAVLERLAGAFRAKLIRYAEDGTFGTRTLRAAREEVVRAILERCGRPPEGTRPGSAEAFQRVLAAPPPIGNESMPFGQACPLPTPASARDAVASLAEWTHAERREEAVFTYGVPPHVIDATARHVLRAAASHGIALLDRLEGMAVAHGIAASREGLVRAQIDAFRRAIERGENDLSPAETSGNWTRLLAQAARLGISVAADARRLPTLVASTGAATAPEVPTSIAEWTRLLDDADVTERAIEELCLRGASSALAPIAATLPTLVPEACMRAFAWLGMFGATARPTLLACLASEQAHVRQGAALALARVADQQALCALGDRLDAESTEVWKELARALGDVGDPVLDALTDGTLVLSQPDRLALVMAHLAARGLAQDIENMENTPASPLAGAARAALALRPEVDAEDRAVRSGAAELVESTAAARLSRDFYRAARELGA